LPWLTGHAAVDVELPRYDRVSRRRADDRDALHLAPDVLLIVEGVPALTMSLPGKRRTHRVFVEGAEERRRQRVIADLIWRGGDERDAAATYIERWRDETPVVVASRATADAIVNCDPPTDTEGPNA
jgi:uridine kinase